MSADGGGLVIMATESRVRSKLGEILLSKHSLHTPGWSDGLPDFARKRMGLAALLLGLAFGVAGGGLNIGLSLGVGLPLHAEEVAFHGVSTLLSVLMFAATRSRRLSDRAVVKLGFLYQFIMALLISFLEGLYHLVVQEPMRFVDGTLYGMPNVGISWVCVLLLLFPLLVPATPRKTFLVACATAATGPLAYLVIVWSGLSQGSWLTFLNLYVPVFIVADMATIPAFIVHHLGREMRRARELGSYRLTELLGKGGMGEVWKAKHRMLARPAAVKLIRPEVLSRRSEEPQTVLRRFEREAQATAALGSPHTIDLYDFGVAADGVFYYVMELLDGLNLDQLVRRFGPLPAARVVHLLRQVCHSLADAHEQGLIHRDIKPANIYTCRLGRDLDFIKVLDFGLVKPSPDLSMEEATITQEGQTLGTPAFMAPEVVVGNRSVDARVDTYALGCVAYWLLTGQTVFEAETPMQAMVMHAKDAPDPPSRRTELPIPARVDDVILACLEKDPERRPPSMDALMQMLDEIHLAEPWTTARARQWWDTHFPAPVTTEPVAAMPREVLT